MMGNRASNRQTAHDKGRRVCELAVIVSLML